MVAATFWTISLVSLFMILACASEAEETKRGGGDFVRFGRSSDDDVTDDVTGDKRTNDKSFVRLGRNSLQELLDLELEGGDDKMDKRDRSYVRMGRRDGEDKRARNYIRMGRNSEDLLDALEEEKRTGKSFVRMGKSLLGIDKKTKNFIRMGKADGNFVRMGRGAIDEILDDPLADLDEKRSRNFVRMGREVTDILKKNKNYVRMGRSVDIDKEKKSPKFYVRMGRSNEDEDAADKRSDKNFIRMGKAVDDKRSKQYVRFGRGAGGTTRAGQYVRLGRSDDASHDVMGRGGRYVRFGKRDDTTDYEEDAELRDGRQYVRFG